MVKTMKALFPVFMSLMLCFGLIILTEGCAQKPPTITKVDPMSGSASGGTAITITGKGFKQGAKVMIGGAPAQVTKVTPGAVSTITAMTPAGSAGPAAIVVTNQKAKVGSLPFSGFSYYEDVMVTTTNPDPIATPELEAPISKIDVGFNQSVDPASVAIAVMNADGTPVDGMVSPDPADDKMFHFDAKEPLKAGQSYKVSISGAKGIAAGNTMVASHDFEFKIKEGAKAAAKTSKKKK